MGRVARIASRGRARGRIAAALLAIAAAMTVPGGAARASGAGEPRVTAAMPAEFAALAETQRAVIDVYLGDRRLGQFGAEVGMTRLRLLDPAAVAAAVPALLDRAAVTTALAAALDVGCGGAAACDPPPPEVVAGRYDPATFRLTLVINPRLLAVQREDRGARYLAPAPDAPSAVDSIGVAVAGGGGLGTAYSIRNRLIAGVDAFHVQWDSSLSSLDGLNVDVLAAELDRRDLRFRGGLFHAPGADLVGRRRIVGMGVATQFDTRTDRLALSGSPLVVFLAQRSRVDLYVQGRLVSSHVFDGGNQALDTSILADGSYPIELRIQEAGGATRTERRFFTKSAALAPAGRVVFHAQAGLLAPDGIDRPVAIERTPLATAGAIGRIGTHLAWDVATMATPRNALAEAGVSLLTPLAQARVALLGSRRGDVGMVAQLGSTGAGPLSYSVDLRRLRSVDGRPLIDAGDAERIRGAARRPVATMAPGGDDRATYTQLLGNISYHLPRAQIGLSALLYRAASRETVYAIGPSARWSLLQRDRLQLSLNGNVAATQRGTTMAVGLQLQVLGARSAASTTMGAQSDPSGVRRGLSPVVEASASLHRGSGPGEALDAAATVQRSDDGTIVQLAGEQRGNLGSAALSLSGRLDGPGAGLQYGLTAQTSIGLAAGGLRIGAQGQNDSLLSVAVRGDAAARFELLVDDAVRGTLRGGQRLSIAVQPYRRYKVRLRAVGQALLAFDTRTRIVDVYPGSIAVLDWSAQPVVAMFGRLLDAAGAPVADADITAGDAVAASDARGYFQIQAAPDALLTVRTASEGRCTAKLAAPRGQLGYTRLGDVLCRS